MTNGGRKTVAERRRVGLASGGTMRAFSRLRGATTAGLIGAVLLLAAAPVRGAEALQPLRLGAAWYPEQWPQARWEADLQLMEQAHVNVVRIAEFAWSTLEPREGVYDFAWLDAAIAAAARHHIAVVLGTPTAAPPAWLTSKYPDTLRVDEDGRREEHGQRQQFSFTSPRYRALARDIAERMATRYGHDPRVIGWQVDNEVGPVDFSDTTKAAWQAWLAAKYGTVGRLNERWTTAYWSQTYDRFDEVPFHSKDENPALLLDYHRFVSETWNDYVEDQARVIRAHAEGRQFVTTNLTHWTARFDPYRLNAGLDLAAWDDYVPDGRYDWQANAVQHDLARGYKRADFWVMETQPAYVDWWPVNRALDPGQTREMAWQAVGHGADAVLYWQWRSALNGQEQYHGRLLGPDGEPAPIYGEVARTGAEFARASEALAGTSPHAEVAILDDLDSRWAIDAQRFHKDFDPVEELTAFYRPLETGAQRVDVVSPSAPLERYRLVVAPALNVLTDPQAARLKAYVEAGGHLVLGPRSGMKDAFNALHVQRQPGPLVDLLGARVEQFYALDTPVPLSGAFGPGEAKVWAETLQVRSPDVRVLMRYGRSNGWLDGQPAIVTRRVGRGSITYVGAWLKPPLMQALADRLLKDAGVGPVLAGVAPDVEVAEREGAGKRVLVLINHGDAPQAVVLPRPMHDVLNGGDVGSVSLPAHGVAVLAAKPSGS
jgi:beta-galactosidase